MIGTVAAAPAKPPADYEILIAFTHSVHLILEVVDSKVVKGIVSAPGQAVDCWHTLPDSEEPGVMAEGNMVANLGCREALELWFVLDGSVSPGVLQNVANQG